MMYPISAYKTLQLGQTTIKEAVAPFPESSCRAYGTCPSAHRRRSGRHEGGDQLAGRKREGNGAGHH